MALSVSAANINTKAAELWALIETHIETLTASNRADELQIVFLDESNVESGTSKTNWALDSDLLPSAPVKGQKFRIPISVSTAGPTAKIPLKAGRFPLYWIITNDAGDVS